MTTAETSQPTVKSAMRTLDLIEYVVARPAGATAQEISSALAIPASSLSYLLSTLVERTYLHRERRRYFAGSGLDRLQRPRAERSLADRAAPLIRALRLQLHETASLFQLVGWEMEAIITETAAQTLRYSIDVGTRVPLHCVAAGKALLAQMNLDELNRYFDESERKNYTEHTISTKRELLKEISIVRKEGFARTRNEHTPGISGIGAAICVDGVATAAIGVAVPSMRFTPDVAAQVIEQVVKTANILGDLHQDPD